MNWIKLLEEAPNERALLRLVNEYLAQVRAWEGIPDSARPTAVAREEDVHRWHQRLVDALQATAHPGIRLQDLCVFFLRASARAHELRGNGSPPSNESSFSGRSDRSG